MRNGDVSFWWQNRGLPPRRAALPGSAEADVCIVGAGFTGLWTAYYLKRVSPDLRVIVLEGAFAGFGASGRNGGWLTAEMVGSRARYARGPHGREGVTALSRALRSAVDEVAHVCAAESIDCGLVKGGSLTVATSPAQVSRLRSALAADRSWGDGPADVAFLSASSLRSRINVAGALGALFTPHCARLNPAALVAGLADAVVALGVPIYEATPVTEIIGRSGAGAGSSAVARTAFGDVRARYVLRCTEGFTARLPGQRRTLLPMNSAMIMTAPLPAEAWREIGWDDCETLGDAAHAYMYAQRTSDGRIALGGRGVPYRFGSGIDHRGAVQAATVDALTRVLHRMFPAAAAVPVDHAWCGVLGVPRDWCAAVSLDPATGLGWAGGYTGHGVAAANLAGRTLTDLVLGVASPLTSLPWVAHRSRRWEPEPARWAGVRGLYSVYRLADRLESAPGGPRVLLGKALGRAGDLISGIPS